MSFHRTNSIRNLFKGVYADLPGVTAAVDRAGAAGRSGQPRQDGHHLQEGLQRCFN